MSALQSQYEQRIAKLEGELRGAQEAKESLEATYRQLKRDKTQNVWMGECCYDFILQIGFLSTFLHNLHNIIIIIL